MAVRRAPLAAVLVAAAGLALFAWHVYVSPLLDTPTPGIVARMMAAERRVVSSSGKGHATAADCNHYNCFDVYRCGQDHAKILVHISDPVLFVDESNNEVAPWTQEFVDVMEAIEESEFYTDDPSQACIFIPSVDLLSERNVDAVRAGAALASTQYWGGGLNNLVFSMLPGAPPAFLPALGVPHGRAMVAGAGLSSHSFRQGFDVAIPTFSHAVQALNVTRSASTARKWLLVSTQIRYESSVAETLKRQQAAHPKRLLVLDRCLSGSAERCADGERVAYPGVMTEADFCLIVRGARLTQSALMDALHCGCVPVVAIDGLVLPFSDVVDWKRFSIRIYEHDLHRVVDIVSDVSRERVAELQAQLKWVYAQYFSSVRKMALTTLHILNDRLFPHRSKTYMEWNVPASVRARANPLALATGKPPAVDGFTAVILTYDRLQSLWAVMARIDDTPSLNSIVVVWNNPAKAPPPLEDWPKFTRPFRIIRTKANLLSNRFVPYREIETECVLSMDDDIDMLTPEELEFGYHVWREFPDRLVGFPSRSHVWNNATGRWRYESDWGSQISMVLTGAAFYHKYWGYLYTAAPSPEAKAIKEWVDANVNCEDIAMNFLVANATGKAPVKVAPRKKFRCLTPHCTNSDMLSAMEGHMMERSDCVNYLVQKYGLMPLQTTEFRADPLLFRESVPEQMKAFKIPDVL